MKAAALLLAVLALAGCGVGYTRAPISYEELIDRATSGISDACGEAYQVAAFGGSHPRAMTTLEVSASSWGRKLAKVYHRNPQWSYLGQTVAQMVQESHAMLSSCGLPGAAKALSRAAYG